MDLPPVPLWFVKSPPWHMKFGITRWKEDPLNPNPFSPVQRHLKFSAVFGTTSVLSSITIRPRGWLFAVTSKNTCGSAILLILKYFLQQNYSILFLTFSLKAG